MQIKFDVDFYNFKILGACKALLAEDKISLLLRYYSSGKNCWAVVSFCYLPIGFCVGN